MFSVLLHCDPGDEDRLTAELWEQGTAGLADEPGGVRAFFEGDQRAPEIMRQFASLNPTYRREDDTDWAQVSRDAWPPIEVGERFFLTPPWRDDLVPLGRLRLIVYPGMACGTGRHPATQLALEGLERSVFAGATVVDVGTGSGILSAAAKLLGASTIFACDIDLSAVAIARNHAEAAFFVGSADAIQSSVADIVVANISSDTIEQLRPELERITRDGGTLILSGFPSWDLPGGFQVQETLEREGWACLIAKSR